jgi:hypothetical protein
VNIVVSSGRKSGGGGGGGGGDVDLLTILGLVAIRTLAGRPRRTFS